MLPFDFIGQASVASLFAIGAREEIKATKDPLRTRGLIDLVVFSALVYTPSIAFFVTTWPSWYVMYSIDVESSLTGIGLLLAINIYGQILCAVGGYALTARYLRRARAKVRTVVWAVLAVWAVQLPLYFGVWWSRSFTVVPFSEYEHRPGFPIDWGEPHSFWGGPILPWWIFWVVNDVCWLLFFYRRLRRRAQSTASEGR